jgi:hypothetical protein
MEIIGNTNWERQCGADSDKGVIRPNSPLKPTAPHPLPRCIRNSIGGAAGGCNQQQGRRRREQKKQKDPTKKGLQGTSGSRGRVRASPTKCGGWCTGKKGKKKCCESAAEQHTLSCQQLTSSAGVSRTAAVGSWDDQSSNTEAAEPSTSNEPRLGPLEQLNFCAASVLSQTPNSTPSQQPNNPRSGGGGSRYVCAKQQQLEQHALQE